MEKESTLQTTINENEEFNGPLEEVGIESIADTNEVEGSSCRGKRKVQRTSPVWQYFDLEMRPNEKDVIKERAICQVYKQSHIG